MSLATAPATRPPFLVSLVLCSDCARRAIAGNPTVGPVSVLPSVDGPIAIPLADEEPTWEEAEWC